jgi:hypothetical protein
MTLSNSILKSTVINSPDRFIALTVSDAPSVHGLYEEGHQRRMCRLEKADRLTTSATRDGTGALYAVRHAHEMEGALLTNIDCSVWANRGNLACLRYVHQNRAMPLSAPMDRRTCVYAAAASCGEQKTPEGEGQNGFSDAAECVEYVYRHGGGFAKTVQWFPTAAIKAAVWRVDNPNSSVETVKRVIYIEEERLGKPFVINMNAWHGMGSEDHFANNRTCEEKEWARRNVKYGCSSTNALKRALGSMASYTDYRDEYRSRGRRPPWSLSYPSKNELKIKSHTGACCVLYRAGLLKNAYLMWSECTHCKAAILASPSINLAKAFLTRLYTPIKYLCDHLFVEFLPRVTWHPDMVRHLWRTLLPDPDLILIDPKLRLLLRLRFYVRVWQRKFVRIRRQIRACVTIQSAWIEHAYAPGGIGYRRILQDWNEHLAA